MAKKIQKSQELETKLSALRTRLAEFENEAAEVRERHGKAHQAVASGAMTLAEMSGLQIQRDSAKVVIAELQQQIAATENELQDARRVEAYQACESHIAPLAAKKADLSNEFEQEFDGLVKTLETTLAGLTEKQERFKAMGLEIRNAIMSFPRSDFDFSQFMTDHNQDLNIFLLHPEQDKLRAIIAALINPHQDVRVVAY